MPAHSLGGCTRPRGGLDTELPDAALATLLQSARPVLPGIWPGGQEGPNQISPGPARLGPPSTKVEPKSEQVLTDIDPNWSISASSGPNLARAGSNVTTRSTKFGPRPAFVSNVWPSLVDFGQLCPTSSECVPTSTKYEPSSTQLGQVRPNLRRLRLTLANFDEVWAGI